MLHIQRLLGKELWNNPLVRIIMSTVNNKKYFVGMNGLQKSGKITPGDTVYFQ